MSALLILAAAAALQAEAPDRSAQGDVRCAVTAMTEAFGAPEGPAKQAALDRAHALIAQAQAREPEIDMIDWFEEEAAAIERLAPDERRRLIEGCRGRGD